MLYAVYIIVLLSLVDWPILLRPKYDYFFFSLILVCTFLGTLTQGMINFLNNEDDLILVAAIGLTFLADLLLVIDRLYLRYYENFAVRFLFGISLVSFVYIYEENETFPNDAGKYREGSNIRLFLTGVFIGLMICYINNIKIKGIEEKKIYEDE